MPEKEENVRRPRIYKETSQRLDDVKEKIRSNVVPYVERSVFIGGNGRVKNDKVINEALKKLEEAVDEGEYWKENPDD